MAEPSRGLAPEPDYEEVLRARRLQLRRPRRRQKAKKVVLVVLVAAVVVLVGVVVKNAIHLNESAGSRFDPLAAGPRALTSTTIGISNITGSYRAGDCVTWGATGLSPERPATVVACDQPHFLEMAGGVLAPIQYVHYPSVIEWRHIFDTACLDLVQRMLRRTLNPDGPFFISGLKPVPDSWALGDRQIWCGLAARRARSSAGDTPEPWTGRAEDIGRVEVLSARIAGLKPDQDPIGSRQVFQSASSSASHSWLCSSTLSRQCSAASRDG